MIWVTNRPSVERQKTLDLNSKSKSLREASSIPPGEIGFRRNPIVRLRGPQ